MVIRILDVVSECNTAEDGTAVYEHVRIPLAAGDEVFVSFDGITEVPSSFVNAAIVRLFEDFPLEFLRQNLRLVDANVPVANMVVRCMRNGINRIEGKGKEPG